MKLRCVIIKKPNYLWFLEILIHIHHKPFFHNWKKTWIHVFTLETETNKKILIRQYLRSDTVLLRRIQSNKIIWQLDLVFVFNTYCFFASTSHETQNAFLFSIKPKAILKKKTNNKTQNIYPTILFLLIDYS